MVRKKNSKISYNPTKGKITLQRKAALNVLFIIKLRKYIDV